MSALTHDVAEFPGGGELLDAFLALETPTGFKAELIEGKIVVTPPPDGEHEIVIGRVVRQVFRKCAEDFEFAPTKGLRVLDGRYIPDGTFTKEGAFMGAESWWRPEGVLMVLEVTPKRPGKDREEKREGYAAAGIPLYLLIDRKADRVVLHSDPEDGKYRDVIEVKVGDPLDLPAPFSFSLDTGALFRQTPVPHRETSRPTP
ncbi:Uma2 family endonuclease [Kitasatospora sp. RB6PN24]|uniref:Uma2 family endonuclease n=1 Tax=Kitasatospora humi TaxID=2893891 RepID=UPI001E3AE9F0|nr:Uma2 family endonuclease [Kitasatospora humi]MCC9306999.1 Uma2 family endonuclease [Kitasatospora humi]